MRYWHAVFALLVALVLAAVLTPFAARLARWIGALDKPRDRGLAVKETPTLGGLAIFVGVLVAGAIWLPRPARATGSILLGAARSPLSARSTTSSTSRRG